MGLYSHEIQATLQAMALGPDDKSFRGMNRSGEVPGLRRFRRKRADAASLEMEGIRIALARHLFHFEFDDFAR